MYDYSVQGLTTIGDFCLSVH